LVLGVPQTFNHFARMQDRISDFVVAHSKIKRDQFVKMMMNTSELVTDIGTVLDGEQAVKEGLIDHLGGLHDAIERLYLLIEKENSHG
jgi:ATP-dependent protease ClpP protease subunit